MVPIHKFSRARSQMSRITDEVQAGGLAVVERRGFRMLLTSFDEQRELLEGGFEFHPEVLLDGDGVGIWLPELPVHGQGETLEQAEDDVIDAALDYADMWFDQLHRAPNHVGNRGWVWRLAMADDRDALRRVLFGR